jgi:thiol-disulfide isomerase/thioredoxin
MLARVEFASARRFVILEPANITIDINGTATGSSLNEAMETLANRINDLESEDTDSTRQILKTICTQTIEKNNAVGYYALLQLGYYLNLSELDDILAVHTYYADFTRIKKLRSAKVQAANTAPGHKYADFEIAESDSVTTHLSDYVKPGEYTIVDFWASWCRYCIMEIPNLKSLKETYGNRGLNIVGVAVWDERDASEKSIAKHEVDWPQILNAQSIPTDLYGVTGIPQIMLIDPEGTIVARDLQGERLKAVVDSVMTDFVPQK